MLSRILRESSVRFPVREKNESIIPEKCACARPADLLAYFLTVVHGDNAVEQRRRRKKTTRSDRHCQSAWNG